MNDSAHQIKMDEGDFDLRGGMAVAQIRIANFLRQANSDDMAGKITYLAPVDNASGKIFGKKEKFIAVTRNWGNRRRGCTASGKRNLKDHPYTESEVAQQTKFGTIARMVTARMADPSKMTEDQQAFREQSEYDTMRKFLWHLIAAELED